MKRLILALLTVFFFIPMLIQAQQSTTQTRHRRDRVEELRSIKLLDALHLDEETSVRFMKRYRQQQAEMQALATDRGKAIDQLEQSLKQNNADETGKLLNDVLALDQQISAKRIDFIRGLSSILTKEQQARFVVFDRNFIRDLREMVQERQQMKH